MIPLEEARGLVLAACTPLPPAEVALPDALGCVTAVAVRALGPVPPFDNTAMDGFAVRSEDTAGATPVSPVKLGVVGTLAAGAPPDIEVRPGCALKSIHARADRIEVSRPDGTTATFGRAQD